MRVMDTMRNYPVDWAAFKSERPAHAKEIFDQLWRFVSAMSTSGETYAHPRLAVIHPAQNATTSACQFLNMKSAATAPT
jgi:hypothetical protein